jgi:hypothetical protein
MGINSFLLWKCTCLAQLVFSIALGKHLSPKFSGHCNSMNDLHSSATKFWHLENDAFILPSRNQQKKSKVLVLLLSEDPSGWEQMRTHQASSSNHAWDAWLTSEPHHINWIINLISIFLAARKAMRDLFTQLSCWVSCYLIVYLVSVIDHYINPKTKCLLNQNIVYLSRQDPLSYFLVHGDKAWRII